MRPLTLAGLVAVLLVAPGWAQDENVVTAVLHATDTEAAADVTIAPGWHVNAHQPRDEFLIPTALTVKPPPGVQAGAVTYPAPVDRALAFSPGKPLLLYEGTIRLAAPLTGTPQSAAEPVRATLRYQACTDERCLPPRTLELVAETRKPSAAADTVGADNEIARWVERWGWGLTFVWVGVLGLALNLTPCVYPLISVTVAFFGGRTGVDEGRAVVHALLYVLGICLTFSALGALAAVTGSLFGAALQQPAVLGGIALLMVVLALGNFGLYQVRMPTGVMQWAGRAGEGPIGALFMGLTMGVVGAPCIGPIVAALLLYVGARQSVPLGLALFFTLGFGMGLPYIALALVAGRLRRLPRGGAWLERMEWLFGFLLLALALHFATPLLPGGLVQAAWALLLTTAGVVLGFIGRDGRPVLRRLRQAAGVATVAFGMSGLLIAETVSPITWTPFSDQALAGAVSAGKPVLIDFEATWCIPCREMDRTTWKDPEVVRATAAYATFKADVTQQDDAASALMERYGVAGVPTYVILDGDGHERRRLVGFVPVERMLDALRDPKGADHG